MSIDQRVLNVIRGLYDAAMEESLWPKALQALIDLTGSQAASFWVLDSSEQPRLPTFTCINFDPVAIEEYLAQTAPLDPTVRYLVQHPHQAIVHDGMVITEREKDRHPYYDWHERRVDTRFRMVGQVHPAPEVQAGVALHRTRTAGRYEADDIQMFAVLHEHLEKALAIGFRLGSLGAMKQCTMELLDSNPAAVLLLDERRQIVYANRQAEELGSNYDGIRFSSREIVLPLSQDHNRLQCLIGRALAAVTSTGADPGGLMGVLRPSGKRPYIVVVAPVSGRYPALSMLRPAVCVFITDPDRKTKLPNRQVQAAFGLTEAEARLACVLATGAELRSAAAELKITYGTARARLTQIFEKTDTSRQGELIKLLLTTLSAA